MEQELRVMCIQLGNQSKRLCTYTNAGENIREVMFYFIVSPVMDGFMIAVLFNESNNKFWHHESWMFQKIFKNPFEFKNVFA